MIWMKYLLGAKLISIHYLFELSLQVGKIYILPLFLPNDKNWVSGKRLESHLVCLMSLRQKKHVAGVSQATPQGLGLQSRHLPNAQGYLGSCSYISLLLGSKQAEPFSSKLAWQWQKGQTVASVKIKGSPVQFLFCKNCCSEAPRTRVHVISAHEYAFQLCLPINWPLSWTHRDISKLQDRSVQNECENA